MLDGGSDGDNGKRVSDVGTRDGEIKIRNCIHTFIVSEETVEKDARDEVRGCHGTRERTSIRDGPGLSVATCSSVSNTAVLAILPHWEYC